MPKMTAKQFAANAKKYIGQPYSKIDCAKLVNLASNGAITAEGSNTQWRKETYEKGRITDGKPTNPYPAGNDLKSTQLEIGMGVFCHKSKDTKKYPDGLGDYCHVGIVTSVKPLRITNASSEYGKVMDYTRIGTFCAWCRYKDIDYTNGKQTTETKEEGPMMYQAKTNVGDLNVRKSATKSAASITKLKKGVVVSVYEVSGDWSRCQAGSVQGWIMNKFLTKIASEDDSTAQKAPESDSAASDAEERIKELEARMDNVEAILEALRGD